MKWIVVGAGSGGCVAARRLHDAGHEVVLVEAGPALVPGHVPATIDGDDSFAALAEPGRMHGDVVAVRSEGQPARPYPRGRGVGGSSAVNAMVALAGSADLYRSWGWNDVDALRDRILVPIERPAADELGRVDRLLLAASPDAAIVPLTRHAGRRVTVAEAYLWPCLSSERLRIVSDAIVDVVTFDRSHTAATGVRLATGASLAADAVVLASGAIHTPAILLRSGAKAPHVGESLQDHPAAGLTLDFDIGASLGSSSEHGQRGLSTAATIEADPIQILALNHLGPAVSERFGMLLVALTRPTGPGGRVRLRSDDPHTPPIVEFRHLSDPVDLARLGVGVRSALDVLHHASFASAVRNVLIDDRGTTVDRLDDDEYLDRWLRTNAADYVHASCSTSLSIGDAGAVLGHDGLYVCDASAFPSIPNANTHVPTMMLAERFSAAWLG